MPYTNINPPNAIKNKSPKAIAAGVKAANSALERGLSEEDAVFAAIAAANNVDKPKKKVEKKYEDKVPLHLLAVLNKQVEETQEIQKANDPSKELVSADFDKDNRLVLTFDDGSVIKTKPINIDHIVQNVSILAGGANQDIGFNTVESNPSFTYTDGLPTRIDYISGNHKILTYTTGTLTRLDYFIGEDTYRKDYYYNLDGTLDYITESTIT